MLFGAWLVSWLLPKPYLMPSYGYLENLTWKVHVYFPSSTQVLLAVRISTISEKKQKPAKAVEFSLANKQISHSGYSVQTRVAQLIPFLRVD